MTSSLNPVIAIPSRLGSTRLPNKPLADIQGDPMIVHVWRRACEADIGPVIVACAEQEIADVIAMAGGTAVMTDPDLPSGSDRVFAAVESLDPERRHDVVVNMQGDLPTLDPASIRDAIAPLANPDVDIGTLAAIITDDSERNDPNAVKAVADLNHDKRVGRALYFSRAVVPTGDGPHFHHIGLYAFRRVALARFVSLPPGALEQREGLEQLRALEDGMRIDISLVDTVPDGVDTPADLERARARLSRGMDGSR